MFGGEGGIRTHGDPEATTVFETAPFNHSGTSPWYAVELLNRYFLPCARSPSKKARSCAAASSASTPRITSTR